MAHIYPSVGIRASREAQNSFGARLTNYYQSWLIFRDSYIHPEPINNSSENELKGGNHRRKRVDKSSELKAKGIERVSKANFSLFPRSSRELFF